MIIKLTDKNTKAVHIRNYGRVIFDGDFKAEIPETFRTAVENSSILEEVKAKKTPKKQDVEKVEENE